MIKIANLLDFIYVLPQYIIPQHSLSRCIFHITRCQQPLLKMGMIKLFIRYFNVDMNLAREPEAEAYISFNHFFTRQLKSNLRQVTKDGIASPVDGTISQIGTINNTKIIQAKGKEYDLEQLLVGNDEMISLFTNGYFAALYLAPCDYHRIHMPVSGRLRKMFYVPGKLFSVSTRTTRAVKGLFARNERVISLFDTDIGPMAVIMVGAIFVGSMETVWAGQITPSEKSEITNWSYFNQDNEVLLNQGDELGRFNMGSTVILLFGNESIEWLSTIQSGSKITMGSCLGILK